MKAFLYPVWFLLGSIFSYFAFLHWRYSKTPLRPFYLREEEESEDSTQEILNQNELAREVVKDLNNYIEKMNSISKKRNRASSIGYFIAAAICLISMLMVYVV